MPNMPHCYEADSFHLYFRRFLPSGGHAGIEAAPSDDAITYGGATASNITLHSNTTSQPPVTPPIEYPFAIVGAITALVGLVQLVICCLR